MQMLTNSLHAEPGMDVAPPPGGFHQPPRARRCNALVVELNAIHRTVGDDHWLRGRILTYPDNPHWTITDGRAKLRHGDEAWEPGSDHRYNVCHIHLPFGCGAELRGQTLHQFQAGIAVSVDGYHEFPNACHVVYAQVLRVSSLAEPNLTVPSRKLSDICCTVNANHPRPWQTWQRTGHGQLRVRLMEPPTAAPHVLGSSLWWPMRGISIETWLRYPEVSAGVSDGVVDLWQHSDQDMREPADIEALTAHGPHSRQTQATPWGYAQLPGGTRDDATWCGSFDELANRLTSEWTPNQRLRVWGPSHTIVIGEAEANSRSLHRARLEELRHAEAMASQDAKAPLTQRGLRWV